MVGYYKKTFSGTKLASSNRSLYAMNLNLQPSSTLLASNYNSSFCKVVGDCVASTLRECGLSNCYFDEDNGYLFFKQGIDKSGMYMYNNSNSGIYFIAPKNVSNSYIYRPSSPSLSSNGRGYGGLFNGYITSDKILKGSTLSFSQDQDYSFSVIIKGNTNTFFRIFIQAYNEATEIEMCGIGFFDWGENKNAIVGYQMHAVTGISAPYWYLITTDNLIFLNDTSTLNGNPSTSNMSRPAGLTSSYLPKNGYSQTSYCSINYLSLSPLIFNYNMGVVNPKIFYMPYQYFNNTDLTLDNTTYERFFRDGDRIFMQESMLCIELTDTTPSENNYVSGTKNVTTNGTYNASSDGFDGYSSVTVNVPSSSGNATVIDLGEFTFDSSGKITTTITSSIYSGYQNLTDNNFLIDITSSTATSSRADGWFTHKDSYTGNSYHLQGHLYWGKSYTASSGKLTFQLQSYVTNPSQVTSTTSTGGVALNYSENSKTSGNYLMATAVKARVYLYVPNS